MMPLASATVNGPMPKMNELMTLSRCRCAERHACRVFAKKSLMSAGESDNEPGASTPIPSKCGGAIQLSWTRAEATVALSMVWHAAWIAATEPMSRECVLSVNLSKRTPRLQTVRRRRNTWNVSL